jgi:hypothetical protein
MNDTNDVIIKIKVKRNTTRKKEGAVIENDANIVRKYCKRGTRKNKDGNCEPILPEQNDIVTETNQNIGIVTPTTGKKYCKRGTRKNKDGNCEPILPEENAIPQNVENDATVKKKTCKRGTRKNKNGNCEPINMNQQPTIQHDSNNDVDEMPNLEPNESNDDFDFLYPDLDDPDFNIKIAKKKEFNDTQYDGTLYDIKKQADILCKMEFELMPHQLFVRNFLSLQTPYNSLFLYHGLGSGKTCSAIGIAEEMRSYMKQIQQSDDEESGRIIVIASPNVQMNFRMQLFDPSKLIDPSNNETGEWNIKSCVGNSLLKEFSPASMKGLTRDKIEANINKIIDSSYEFFGYTEFTNKVLEYTKNTDNEELKKQRITDVFSNRLIIIDEVHNLRIEDGKNKNVTEHLFYIVKEASNVRLLLLSATPMYNSYKEIIWITNLLNANDGRSSINVNDVFDENGIFKTGGRELLKRKLTGYVSYVRGENPYTFPYRIYPDTFDESSTFSESKPRPTIQLSDGNKITDDLQHIKPYLTEMEKNGFQEKYYLEIMDSLKNGGIDDDDVGKTTYGYNTLLKPIQALNFVFPQIVGQKMSILNATMIEHKTADAISYDYRESTLKTFGRIFSKGNINKYSSKISKICDIILRSTGTVLIYSQFIDDGIIPMALALEEMGFLRYSTTPNTMPLLKEQSPKIKPIDSIHLKTKDKIDIVGHQFKTARYLMITGEQLLSPNNTKDLAYFNDPSNNYGVNAKVVLISRAGAEGLDYKNVRQIHVLDPWYNMNRIEQIIGRGVRNLSHCNLKFEERNVEIYLHATLITNPKRSNEECADLYIYRMAERKSIKIGNVTRLLKETSVDCLLNVKQSGFTIDKLNTIAANRNLQIRLSTDNLVKTFQIGDRPFTDACDYKDKCELVCSPTINITDKDIVKHTYSEDFTTTNNMRIANKIRSLFKINHFYKRTELISLINEVKPYPIEQIYSTLTFLVNNRNELLVDKYKRPGILENKDDIYIFKPIEISDTGSSLYEHITPIEYSHQNVRIKLNTELIKHVNQSTFIELMQMVKDNDRIVFGTENVLTDYYSNLQRVKGDLENVHGISSKNIQKYAVHHFLDTTLIEDKITICKNMFGSVDKHESNDVLEGMVKSYFESKRVRFNGVECILFPSISFSKADANILYENILYKLSDFETQKYPDNSPDVERNFLVEKEKVNETYFGYFAGDKKNIKPVFRVTKVAKKKRETVAKKFVEKKADKLDGVLIEKASKSDILKVLNDMTAELQPSQNIAPYDPKKKKTVAELCVLLEIIMREIQSKIPRKEYSAERYTFLSPEEAIFLIYKKKLI